MRNRLSFFAIASLALLVPAILSLRGRAAPPTASAPSADTKVDVESYLYSQLRQHGQIKDPKLSISIYVQKLQGRKLVKPILKRKDAQGVIDWVAHANAAELTVLAGGSQIRVHMQQVVVNGENGSQCSFADKYFVFDVPTDFARK
ncbi:MAG TPA: hypothetical protein VN688_07640 [Gemmataceae bacterium]|nr:hypothetical protein [Gemmataceae bacterium]